METRAVGLEDLARANLTKDMTKEERKRYTDEFIERSLDREQDKMETLGAYDPLADLRSMSREAQDEQVDTLSYMRFLTRKRPDLSVEIIAVKRLALETFLALKVLERMERGQ